MCGHDGNRVIARFPDRTYRRCASCGIISLESFVGRRKKYDAGYFSAEYKAQYGRTYLEDFGAIRTASRAARGDPPPPAGGTGVERGRAGRRVRLRAVPGGAGGRRASGFGLDVSPGAVAHVRKNLGFPALCAGFEEVESKRLPRRIAAVTMWYVIEHFPDTGAVLARASALLPAGGVLAFSTPNGRGISARRDLRAFLRSSPADHFVILSPRGLGRILAPFGSRAAAGAGHRAPPRTLPGDPGQGRGEVDGRGTRARAP